MSRADEVREFLSDGQWHYASEIKETLGITDLSYCTTRMMEAGEVERRGATNSTAYRRISKIRRQTREVIQNHKPETNGFSHLPRLGTIVTGLRWDPEGGDYYISFDSGEEVLCRPKS